MAILADGKNAVQQLTGISMPAILDRLSPQQPKLQNRMSAGLLIFVASLTAVVPGCASLKKHLCCEGPAPQAIVTTGGPYSIAHSFVIPPQGLTLGEVVVQTLRPGIVGVPATSQVVPSMNAPVAKVPQETATANKVAATRWAKWALDRSILPERSATLVEFQLQGVADQLTIQKIHPLIQERYAIAKAALNSPGVDAALVQSELRDDLESIVALSVVSNADDRTPAEVDTAATIVVWLMLRDGLTIDKTTAATRISQTLVGGPFVTNDSIYDTTRGRQFFTDLRTELLKATTVTPISTQVATSTPPQISLQDSLVVILTRASGRSMITPLWMATSYSAADIWLVHGDHIQVAHFKSTNVTTRAAGGSVVVTGITTVAQLINIPGPSTARDIANAEDAAGADVMIVRRVGIAGNLEEYLLPLDRVDVFGSNPAIGAILDQANIAGGDQIHFELMDLTPIILDSRQKLRNASLVSSTTCENNIAQFQTRQKKFANYTQQNLGVSPTSICNGVEELHRNISSNLPQLLQ